MKKLHRLSVPFLLWLSSWVMVVQAQVALPACTTNFTYDFQNNFCPPNAMCLIADHVNYTFDTQQNADYYFWSFGDGSTAIDSIGKVSHQYFKPGTYEVSHIAYFTSKRENKCKAIFTAPISVKFNSDTIANSICIANLQTSTSGLQIKAWDSKQSITADATTQTLYFWNLGDGSKYASGNIDIGINHDYKKEGKYLVTMTKLIMKSYKTSESCDAILTVDSITIMTPCFQKEICRETYTKWVIISNGDLHIPNCNIKAKVAVHNHSITYTANNSYLWKGATSSKGHPINTKIPKPTNVDTYHYWTFGDGADSSYSENNTFFSALVHTYKKAGKYLVKLISTSYYNDRISITMPIYDSVMQTWLPRPMPISCRSVDSVWVEIGKVQPENKCLKINSSGMEITANMELAYIAVFKPGEFRHRYYNFGDGSDTMGVAQATHNYKKNGTYLVTGIEVTYYAWELERMQLYPDSISYQCKALITDPSVRFASPYCPTKEIYRTVCSEWITIQQNKLVTSISPNPANEFVNLNLENADGKVDFMIYNAAGLLVKKIEQVQNGSLQFDTSIMATGLYIYTIVKDGKILKRDKFMVNR